MRPVERIRKADIASEYHAVLRMEALGMMYVSTNRRTRSVTASISLDLERTVQDC